MSLSNYISDKRLPVNDDSYEYTYKGDIFKNITKFSRSELYFLLENLVEPYLLYNYLKKYHDIIYTKKESYNIDVLKNNIIKKYNGEKIDKVSKQVNNHDDYRRIIHNLKFSINMRLPYSTAIYKFFIDEFINENYDLNWDNLLESNIQKFGKIIKQCGYNLGG